VAFSGKPVGDGVVVEDGGVVLALKHRKEERVMTLKVGWVNDYAPGRHHGGSLATQMRAIAHAPAEVEITFCDPSALRTDLDFYVLNNMVMFSEEQLAFLLTKPFIIWAHDLWHSPQPWFTNGGWVRRLVNSARRTIFLSPLHATVFTYLYGVEVPHKRLRLIPAMVDPAPFDALDLLPVEERKRAAFWMATYDRLRCPRLAMEWAEEMKVPLDFYGFGKPPAYLSRSPLCNVQGEVAAGEVPALMAEYQAYVYFPAELDGRVEGIPQYVDACGRTAIEAALAGCSIITSSRLGVTSWPWFSQGREAIHKAMVMAPDNFWKLAVAAMIR
jgi:hypothetical protein